MRKIALIIVGLFMSLVASASTLDTITTNISGSIVNLGSIEFNQDGPERNCYMSKKLSKKLVGGTYVDYIVFDDKGKLTTEHSRMEYVKTEKNKNNAKNIVTIRPIALDEEAKASFFGSFADYKTATWKSIENSEMNKQRTDTGGTTSANVAGSMSSNGFSNSSSAGTAAFLMFMTVNSPSASFIYYVEIQYQDGTKESSFVLVKNSKTPYTIMCLKNIIKELL